MFGLHWHPMTWWAISARPYSEALKGVGAVQARLPVAAGVDTSVCSAVVHDYDWSNTGKGLHSFTLELNLSNSRTRSLLNLGYTVDRRSEVELKSKRV